MNTTPFAQLGQLNKSAMSKADMGLLAADIGVGSIPVVGSVWNAGRAIQQGIKGDWGGAAASGLGALLGVFGGGGAVAGGLNAALKGGRAAAMAAKGVQAARAAGVAAKGLQAARAVGTAAKAVPGVARAVQAAKPLATAAMASPMAAKTMQMANAAKPMVTGAMNAAKPMVTGAYNAAKPMATNMAGKLGTGLNKTYGYVATKRLPFTQGPMGMGKAKAVVDTGLMVGAGSLGGPPPAAPSAPTMPLAPSWYSAVTGNTAIPQF